jgi:hypothetical protein
MTTPTLPILSALNDLALEVAAQHSIEGKISIVLGASGVTRSGQKHGHFQARSWEDSEGNDIHEISLAGESLKRGAVATVGTLIHELAHAYCHENDIKDTSDSGRWHNKKFKTIAEDMGLDIEKADRIGFSVTTVPEVTQTRYAKHIAKLEEAIKVWRRECQDPVATTKGWFERNEFSLYCSTHDESFELFSEGGEDED